MQLPLTGPAIVAISNAARLTKRLGEGPVGDPLTVRKAATTDDAGFFRKSGQKLGYEPRFANARGSKQREQLRRTLRYRVAIDLLEAVQLAISANQRGIHATNVAMDAGTH